MAGITRILALFSSPVLRSAQLVQVGQNASLHCNLTSCDEVTWLLLRSDQLLPLLTVRRIKTGGDTTDDHAAVASRFSVSGDLENASVSLEILEVEEEDAGVYFCLGRCSRAVRVNRGVCLTVTGRDLDPGRDQVKQPCWSLGICVLPGLASLCFVFIAGFYLCTGRASVCCCNSVASDAPSETQDASLLYASVKFAPRPSRSAGGRRQEVTYSAVSIPSSPQKSQA